MVGSFLTFAASSGTLMLGLYTLRSNGTIIRLLVTLMAKATSDKSTLKSKKKRLTKSGTLKNSPKVSTREAAITGTLKRYVGRDAAGRFVGSANEHMLRAWESIHKNNSRERKAS